VILELIQLRKGAGILKGKPEGKDFGNASQNVTIIRTHGEDIFEDVKP
jgi:hypothetical protein